MLKLIGYLFIGFIAVVLVYVDMGWKMFIFDWIDYLPFRDKTGHFLLIGGLTFFVNIVLNLKQIQISKHQFLLGSVLVLVFVTFEEASQHFISTRNCELLDLICNYIGIFVFGKFVIDILFDMKIKFIFFPVGMFYKICFFQ